MNSLFSKRIKALRIERNLTLQDVASYLGVNKSSVSYYEQNKRTPTLNNLLKLSKLFGVSLDYLLGNSSFIKEDQATYEGNDLVLKYLVRSKILKDFILEKDENILEIENYIKSLKS